MLEPVKQLELFNTALNAVANGIALLDAEGNVQWANPAFYHLSGYRVDEILGKSIGLIISDRHGLKLYLEIWNIILAERVWNGELIACHKNGSSYITEVTITPIKDQQGNIVSSIIVQNDVTIRKQAEEFLARYQIISEITSDIILVMDTEGRIMEANEAAVKAYGYSRTELLSLRVHDLRGPENCLVIEEKLRQVMNGGALFEMVQYRKDGTSFWAEMNSVGTIIGRQIMIVSIARDITERKKFQRQMLQANQKIAQAKQLSSIAVMAAGIAHDINQPLNSIKVTADSILYWARQNEPLSMEEMLESISTISQQCSRINQIIKNSRNFMRKQNSLEAIPCNLNEGVENALKLLEGNFSPQEIKIEKILQEKLPPILTLPIRLEEIIINLLSNSLESLNSVAQEEKKITIITRIEDYVILEIKDNGLGIDEKIKEKIFEPFFTTKESKDNLGLGLTIVQSLVSSCQGKIRIKNNGPRGTAVEAMFPIYKGQADDAYYNPFR